MRDDARNFISKRFLKVVSERLCTVRTVDFIDSFKPGDPFVGHRQTG